MSLSTGLQRTSLDLLSFAYDEDNPLRSVVLDGEPWFAAMDVCRLLQLPFMPTVYNADRQDLRGIRPSDLGEGAELLHTTGDAIWLLSEAYSYQLMVRRPLEVARWFSREVLPALRDSDYRPGADSTALHLVPGRRKVTIRNPRPPQANVLYRLFDESGNLLYVGVTHRFTRRMRDHERGQPWWQAVTTMTVEHHPSRAAVLDAELTAIRTEQPRFNIQGRRH